MQIHSQVAFIDTSLPDYQTLHSGLDPSVEVVFLDATQDGLEQIATYLSTKTSLTNSDIDISQGSLSFENQITTDNSSLYDAIHILSHGSPGHLYLGTTDLSADNIQDYQ